MNYPTYPFELKQTYKIFLTNPLGEKDEYYAMITELGTYIYDHRSTKSNWVHFCVLPKELKKEVIREIMDIEKEMNKA